MIRIYQAQDLPQAQLLIDLLDRHGIQAQLLNGHASGALGDIPFTHAYPEIWLLREADLARSKQLLAEFELPLSNEQWHCSYCNEASPVSFDTCWNCERDRGQNGKAI